MLKRLLIGIGIIVGIFLLFKFCEFKKNDDADINYNTNLIQQQIVNVGKLVVTEGHFSEVITYKNQAKIFNGYGFFREKSTYCCQC